MMMFKKMKKTIDEKSIKKISKNILDDEKEE
jgi:hypothetical protein